jgi:hypothetical protein
MGQYLLWDLLNPDIEKFCRTWRKGFRHALYIPVDTHSKCLPIITDTLPILDELVKRPANFIQRCLTGDNAMVNSVANMAVLHSHSACHLLLIGRITPSTVVRVTTFL